MWDNLNQHTNVLVSLIGLFAAIAGILFWRMISRIEKKAEDICDWTQKFTKACGECKVDQVKSFVAKPDFEKSEEDLWQAINHHSHDSKGRVVRS